ncbi:MAG: OstA-like protein [Sediminispirochaetaceae bacterium]
MSILKKKNKKNRRSIAGAAVPVFLLAISAAVILPDKAWSQEEPSTFKFSGDSTSISFSEDDRRTILTGNARIRSEDLLILADKIELSGEDFRYARGRGNVQVENSSQKITLTTESLFYDREREFVRIRDYAEMVDLKNEIIVKCGYLEYFSESELAIFQIGVRILKASEDGQMVCRSDFARYDRNADSLQLSGDPVVYWKGDRYSAVSITINLETDEISLEGDVEGEFTADNEQEE